MTVRQRIAELQTQLYKNPNTENGKWFDNAHLLKDLRRTANRLRKLYEHSCNGCTREKFRFESWEDYDQDREKQMKSNDKAILRCKVKIAAICSRIGVKFYIQGDPRGCSLYLGTNSDNSYHTDGVAIY